MDHVRIGKIVAYTHNNNNIILGEYENEERAKYILYKIFINLTVGDNDEPKYYEMPTK